MASEAGPFVITGRSSGGITHRHRTGREVAVAVGAGASNSEIASHLFMSESTVKAHESRLLVKLDVTNRVQIAILVHDATHS